MAASNLAERFNAAQTNQTKVEKTNRLMTMTFEEVGALTIRFGESKLGQTYKQVVTEDQKYCQWFIRKFAASGKEEHQEFLFYLNLWVERNELEMGIPDQMKPRPKTQGGSGSGKPSASVPTCIDLETEEDTWDRISSRENVIEQNNARRLDMIEDALTQMMGQLQVLTQVAQNQNASPA